MPSRRELLAWAAGFFDGEGCAHIAWRYKRKNGTHYNYPQVSISQSGSIALLRRFRRAVGFGKLYGPMPPAKHQKQVRFLYEANGVEKTRRIARLLRPWLGTTKRAQFKRVLAAAEE